MSYERGFLNKRVIVLNRTISKDGSFGREGGLFVPTATIWANCSYTKGKKALQEGAIDAYAYYMVRCDCHNFLKRESRLAWGDKTYQIEDFKEEPGKNEVQIICVELQK